MPDRPLILAHRGFHREAPENTIVAFEAALDLGVDGFETDIRMSRDGEPVLFHDRTTREGRPVGHLSRNELSRAAGYPVPTLREALERFPEVFWDLELKDSAAAESAVRIVQDLGIDEQVILTSFRHDLVAFIAARTQLRLGLLLGNRPHRAPESVCFPWREFPTVRTLVWDFDLVDEELVAECAEQGYSTFLWGMTGPEEHDRALEFGAGALITDYPEYVSAE
ncbi:MAG: glycerophosphodiester phosphodiesterase [Planctomycetota bacterium]